MQGETSLHLDKAYVLPAGAKIIVRKGQWLSTFLHGCKAGA